MCYLGSKAFLVRGEMRVKLRYLPFSENYNDANDENKCLCKFSSFSCQNNSRIISRVFSFFMYLNEID